MKNIYKLKNICLLTFLFLLTSCGSDSRTPVDSDWSKVDLKIHIKDSLEAKKIAKQVDSAVGVWSGYPDLPAPSKQDSTLQKNTEANL